MVFVCFMYGMFIPVLFPITLLGLFNMYVTERIGLLWFYRKPPMFDESLGNRAVSILKYAPLLMFTLGYWAVGNPQIFDAVPSIKVFSNRAGDPQHDLLP